MDNTEFLKMSNITKIFPGVKALDKASLSLAKGEVHALLGENGAGKSTLIKILGGIYQAEKGEIYFNQEKVSIKNVQTSHDLGVSIIHQELILVPHMTVAQNIFLGREIHRKKSFMLNDKTMNRKAQQLIDKLGIDINATDYVARLSLAQQQMVEIAKALSFEARIIVMDEPTATLTDREVATLFSLIKNLKKQHISVIYISHRMEELFAIADRVTVMRDGTYIGTKRIKETTKDELIEMMVGRSIDQFYKSSHHKSGAPILEVKNINKKGVLNNVSFSLKKGEILGVSGIVGAGRTELMRAIFGIDTIDAGEIYIEGAKVAINNPQDAINNGIVLVPESRKEQGLYLKQNVGYNITIQVLKKFIKFIFNVKTTEKSIISEFIEKLSIKTAGPGQIVNTLSGGNQQKIVIAKWLATEPRVLILDEPTRGVDVGAKSEIYTIMDSLVKEGVSIIMVSSELPEIINLSDRVLVMHDGSVTATLPREEISQQKIMHYATGSNPEKKEQSS